MTLFDVCSWKCLAISESRRINAIPVIETMADAMLIQGVHALIRSDNCLEMVTRVLGEWLARLRARTLFIEPGSPR